MKKSVTMRLSPDLLEKGKKRAQRRNQSFTGLIEHLLADWLEKREVKK